MKNKLNKLINTFGEYDKSLRNLKLQLLKLGYGEKLFPIDGWFTLEMSDSLFNFQKENNLPLTGDYDTLTKDKIEESINSLYL